jgi:flagellin-like hook-associated protein FlgL
MSSDITLASGLRSNLLNLQKTTGQMQKVQNRLATGLKVSSALDNPTNFFTASSLSSRANDLSSLLDGLSNGIQVLQAADNGLTSITKTIESMQSTVRQARQDKSWESETYGVEDGLVSSTDYSLSFSGGATAAAVTVDLKAADQTTFDTDGDTTTWNTDEIVAAINANTSLDGIVKASNDNGQLRIKNLSTATLTVDGLDDIDGTGGASTADETIGGNSTRSSLSNQFNELRDQLDKISDDASFNGINLLQGDLLTLTFNESGTSTLDIQRKNSAGTSGEAINSTNLGIDVSTEKEFQDDDNLDSRLNGLTTALNTIRAQASSFGSNLSMVQNRQDFSKAMINTLSTGSDNLTLADQNEEAANMLSLQTRQQLSQTALSLANQANQGVLRLF